MATILAPFNTAMQLGSGFNSFTQQLCVDRAVIPDHEAPPEAQANIIGPVAQEVTYKATIVDKVTDVTKAMNINAAFAIKYDSFNASGKGDFINTSKIKESDVSFMISVKVINQVIYDHALTKFNPIAEIKESNFADVYGDSFISGFQDGGEFTAVISVKARDRSQAQKIKAEAAINFTKNKLELGLNGNFGMTNDSMLEEHETTISVAYVGGGQDLKKLEEDWSFETMRSAALKFPSLVAVTPMRTYAILTKYTALRSFYSATAASGRTLVPSFEKAGIYVSSLQEAFLDYKTISKNLQVLAFDVSAGILELEPSPEAGATTDVVAKTSSAKQDSDLESLVEVPDPSPKKLQPLKFTKPFPPTIVGLESARQGVRMMLNRVVAEVDAVTRNPELAVDETRGAMFMSPFLFKQLIPIGKPAGGKGGDGAAAAGPDGDVSIAAELQDLADRSGGTAKF
ncbi:hypothetical protein EJ08DRAFT_682947 [Tothia fuscella]|uniref:Uncharacterized protein n=1 Tax=Tothia fuscella TaxID=1048955 RepID=A0A9P4TU99_9PEZI|nr:hypothetical protein EJ08DRAFT_682947 [Tothia fuscella]